MKTSRLLAASLSFATLFGLLPAAGHSLAVAPAMKAPSGLSILELKVTGDEFIILQNNSATAINDLSSYWLTAYNNVNPLSAGVSSSQQQLPVAGLQPGQTLLLSAVPMQTCGASVAGKLSVSFTDGGGFVQLSRSALNQDGAISQTAGDLTSWSATTAGIIPNLPSSTKDPKAVYYRYLNGISYLWQLADLDTTNGCQLNIVVAGGLGSSSAVTPLTLAATSPPATILGVVEAGDGNSPSLPAADTGLNAPQISELLPNPIGTGNDASEEFIELYNPNDKPFVLDGFILQTGLTTAHNYTFPENSIMPARSFKAFRPTQTKLSLSNTSGQAALLDPFGSSISVSAVYKTAKDGQSWSIANNKWYWTTVVTANAANIIKQPAIKKAKSKTASSKISVARSSASQGSSSKSAGGDEAADASNNVHSWVLALVAIAAILYGLYEYRRDIAVRLLQLRSKFGAGRTARHTAEGRRND